MLVRKIVNERNLFVFFVLLKLIITLIPVNYGIGGDEVYYIAMSDRPDIGYLDVPPLSPLLLTAARYFLGTNFLSIHLLPALAGALTVFIAYLMVKKIGGGVRAQFAAMAAVTLAPQYMDFNYCYDTFDKLCWVALLYILMLILKTDNKKYWIYFGIAAGVGLLFKLTILFLGFGIIAALLLTTERKNFLTLQFWTGSIITVAIFSPYIIWQVVHGFPSLEYYQNYSQRFNHFNILDFVASNALGLNPFTIPLWLSGLGYYLLDKVGKTYKVFSIVYFIILLTCVLTNAKPYLLAPFYTVLFVGGAVLIEKAFMKRKWVLPSYSFVVLLTGLLIVPISRPLLPPDVYIIVTGGKPVGNIEKLDSGRLPQNLATRFGWDEMTEKVTKVYNTLSDEDKSKACILTGNYSEAGAIHYLGKKYNLPEPVSGHDQYSVWGPGNNTGEVAIVLGLPLDYLHTLFQEITEMERTDCPYAMAHENHLPIYLCRKPITPFNKMKPWLKWLM